jgi:hypothetical protein
MNKDKRARSLEIIASQIIADKDVSTLMWYIDRMDKYHRMLNCNCMRPKVGALTCIRCDDHDN